MDNAAYHVIIPAAGSSRRLRRLTRDRPKCLLEVAGKPIIEHSLDCLSRRGFARLSLVVGYRRERLMALGRRYRRLDIDYVIAADYATTEHGWSLNLTRHAWSRTRSPVLLMDADNLYDPALLDELLAAPFDDVVLVDERLETGEREEELVLGDGPLVTGFKRGVRADFPDYLGVFVGINRFSSAFMHALYAFMEGFFEVHGRRQKYERVFDRFVAETGAPIHHVSAAGRAWVNINHEDDYRRAQRLAARFVDAEALAARGERA